MSAGVKGETDLFEHSEEHFSAEITKRWSLVRMYGEAVRSDLNILVPERLGVEDYLHHHPLLDIRHRVNRLKLFGCLYRGTERSDNR